MKKQIVQVNGISLAVYDCGGLGEPLLLLHPGGFLASFVWEQVTRQLGSNYRIIAVDLRGHGQSDKPEAGYQLEMLASDLEQVLDFLQIDKAHLVGNSLGAETAVVMAAQIPHKVKSLVLLDGGMLPYVGPDGEKEGTKEEVVAYFRNRAVPEFDSRADVISYFTREAPEWEDWFPHLPVRTLQNGKVTYMPESWISAQICETICDLDLDRCYEAINCPVLFMPAEKEQKLQIKLRNIERWAAALPYTKTVVILESEHLMTVKHSTVIAEHMTAFYRELDVRLPSA